MVREEAGTLYSPVWRYAIFATVLWTLLVVVSAYWNDIQLNNQVVMLASAEARSIGNKDRSLHRWAARSGDLYIMRNDHNPRSPTHRDQPPRDLHTSDGQHLTLVNPAYAMRQIVPDYDGTNGVQTKITAQVPLIPSNAPEDWERKALKALSDDAAEFIEQTMIGGQPYIRLMQPMTMEQGCLKCHEHSGVENGGIRGGMSVSVPLAPYHLAAMNSRIAAFTTHGGVWLIGMGMIGYLIRRGRQRDRERRAYHKLLHDGAEKYRQLVENAPEIVYSFSDQKGALYWSPRVQEVLGYRPEDLHASPMLWHDSIHPDDLPNVNKAIGQAKHGENFDIEYRIRDADGNWHWFQDRNTVLHSDHNETIIEGLASDITDRKRAELALITSEEKFRSIHESSTITAIVSIDDAGMISMWNPGAQKAFGYMESEIIGQPLIVLIPKRYRVAHVAGLRNASESGKHTFIGKTVELSGLHKDGHEFPLEMSLGSWKSGDKVYFSAIINDITERKNYEEGLRLAKEDAEYANFTKTQFLANMSHELRTPLNGIIGFSEIMSTQMLGPLSETYQSYAADIRNSGNLLLSLITEILDTAKLETGNITLNESEIDLLQLAGPCMRLIQQKADEAHITVEVNFPDDLPRLYADETRIKQILLNLVYNAIKFNKPLGKVFVQACRTDDDAFEISVKDTGRGIAAKDIPMVLEPFKQVENIMSRSHEGSGLGLPLSKNLTELHGGTLKITSELNIGTTVTVRFPPERIRNRARENA